MTGPLPPEQEFSTWAEIAGYLGISVREAQYREKNEGLPIRRLEGKKPRVWALQSELDEWKVRPLITKNHAAVVLAPPHAVVDQPAYPTPVGNQQDPNRRQLIRRWVVIGTMAVAIVAIGIAWMLLRSRGVQGPARAEVTGNSLSVVDEMGRTLWQHPFPQQLMDRGTRRTDGHPGRIIQIADLYGKGARQILFLATFANPAGASEVPDYDELYCFSSDGEILWRYRPNITVTLGNTRFNGPWRILDLLVVPGNPTPVIWLAVTDRKWLPGVLLSMSPRGDAAVRFINAGHIFAISSMSVNSGHYILAGGVNNEYNAAYLAVVRENTPPSCSPQTPGTRFECADFRTVNPERYFVFPPTDVSGAAGLPYNAVQLIETAADTYTLYLQEVGVETGGASIYGLSSLLEIQDVSFDDSWAVAHHRFERAGLLPHSLAECPLVKGPSHIRRWDKASGWTTVEVPLKPGVGPDAADRPR